MGDHAYARSLLLKRNNLFFYGEYGDLVKVGWSGTPLLSLSSAHRKS